MVPVFEADARQLVASGAIVYAIAKQSPASHEGCRDPARELAPTLAGRDYVLERFTEDILRAT